MLLSELVGGGTIEKESFLGDVDGEAEGLDLCVEAGVDEVADTLLGLGVGLDRGR